MSAAFAQSDTGYRINEPCLYGCEFYSEVQHYTFARPYLD
jgi:hypothetical protein